MRPLTALLTLLAACVPPDDKSLVWVDSAFDSDSNVGDTIADTDETSEAVDTVETGEEETDDCVGDIEFVGGVIYPDGDVREILLSDAGLHVGLPEAGELAQGRVDFWSLERISASNSPENMLEDGYDLPDAVVMGDPAERWFGTSVWEAFDHDVCTQSTGTDTTGRLFCYPEGSAGTVTDAGVAFLDVEGFTEAAYFGFGYYDKDSDAVIAFDSEPPGDVLSVTEDGAVSLMFSGACSGVGFCVEGLTQGDSIVLASQSGAVFSYDTSTDEYAERWNVDLDGGPAYITLEQWGDGATYVGWPGSDTENQTLVYETVSGDIVYSERVYTSDVASGKTAETGSYIALAQWGYIDPEDEGGAVVLYNQRTGRYRTTLNWQDILGESMGLEGGVSEPYMLMDEGDDGLIAVGGIGGEFVAVIKVCEDE